MREILFRCSSLGKLMTNPTAAALKAGEILSVGAKTYIRELVAQDILGIDFEIGGKPIEKGIECEPEATALLNRVLGLSLVKNTERRSDGFITGECDLFDAPRRAGYDAKVSWSAATFPIATIDAEDNNYLWQNRGYAKLWDADEWTTAYCLVNTPERLIGFEPLSMHTFDHIPEHMRVTTWTVKRDMQAEALMVEKVKAARLYYAQVVAEFERTHQLGGVIAAARPTAAQTAPQVSAAPAALPVSIFS